MYRGMCIYYIEVHMQQIVYWRYVDGLTVNSPGLVWAWTAETRANMYNTLYAQTHARMKEAKLLSDELSSGFWSNVKADNFFPISSDCFKDRGNPFWDE